MNIVSAGVEEALEHPEQNLRRVSGNLGDQGKKVNQLEALARENVMPLMY